MPKVNMRALARRLSPTVWIDSDVVPYAARVTIWGRWFILLAGTFLLAYRPAFWYPEDIEHLVLHLSAVAFNGLVHFRLLTNRPVTWR